MLKQRIITAAILIPVFLILLFTLSAPYFCFFTGLIVMIGAWEWSFLMGVKAFPQSVYYPLLILILMGCLIAFPVPIPVVLLLSLFFWLFAAFLIHRYPASHMHTFMQAIAGIFVLLPCWLAINIIHNAENGVYILLFLFLLIWGADSAAFFVGKKWGVKKLAPMVSPGKTWAGLYGALFATFLIVACALLSLKIPLRMWPAIIILSFVTVIFSVVGDLFESMMKRWAGVKDSGRLLPGHGGVLDRIDSLTAAAPIFVLGAMLIGKFY